MNFKPGDKVYVNNHLFFNPTKIFTIHNIFGISKRIVSFTDCMYVTYSDQLIPAYPLALLMFIGE